MSKRKDDWTEEDFEEYYSQFPEWYWKYGLHDARILSISELELSPDIKYKTNKYDCLEICLDSSSAIYENDISKISLFNYKIKTPDIKISELNKPWWLSDTLTKLSDNNYELEITVEEASVNQVEFCVVFEFAEVQRIE